ncbi:DUF6640 family protein [Sphingobium boeckii]|uniref:Acetyltransferase n=1 Tax=Sphingobium boeckii TaxID=1082345 RepID=A0A7W9ED35_9SPHN|nr:DUF6640 family protein [Sphingobium boeckii]MBB5684873.1 hypothetical protein [Sphingobium boeckii]
MRMPISSRIIYTVASVMLPIGAFNADYNASHQFNPDWTPHARFHGAQTLSFSVLLAVATIYFAWRGSEDRRSSVIATSIFCMVYWVAQAFAIFFPGTAFVDPRFDLPSGYIFGVPGQLIAELVALILTLVAAWLALKPGARWIVTPANGKPRNASASV